LGALETIPQGVPEFAPLPGSTGAMERWLKGGSAFVDFPQ
jgi:hypothetical protein